MELLVVLSILALVAVIAVPAIGRLGPGAEVKAAAHSVAAALRQGRAQAIRDNAEVAVAFNLDERVLAVGAGAPVQLRPDIALSMLTASTELLGAGAARIRFYPDGTSTGGRVSVARDGVVYNIYVDWLTGRVDFIR
jgi:general secretion pathway protein H